MKIIPLHNNTSLNHWIEKLQQENPIAQREIYTQFSSKMLSVCRSYVKDIHHAEDCLVKGFMKVFKNSKSYQFKGSFEGWVRKIMVNECLNFIKSNHRITFLEETSEAQNTIEFQTESYFDAQQLLDQLPEGYRIIFNLYVLEEYAHKEIAELLKISENTSKSQLFKAKSKLRELYNQQIKAQNGQ